ncbi:MAG: SusD/RagB family nutrient-binding outer membrane lipoprotein [Chitinophagales bacterium]|nr:SusD/RagB family nutrient-binding outer membrane lipoprotein [Chitinophagales bacterium]
MKKLLSISLLTVVLLFGSCEKFLDCELCKDDPNNPTVTTPALLLPVIELATFSSHMGQLSRLSNLFTQTIAGTDFQFQQFAVYNIAAQDLNNEWNQLYATGMINCQEMIDLFGEGNPYYSGIARVYWAMNLGVAADLWGDVPFSEALLGRKGLLTAKYDPQEDVIQGIQSVLSDAITDLSMMPEDNLKLPGGEDFVYGGDADAYLRIAHVLKARYAMRLSKKDASAASTNTLTHLNNAYAAGFSSTADDMNGVYGSAGNELNQWYAFQTSRANYLKMGANLVDLMNSISDPRLPFYATTDGGGGYSGTPIGSFDQTTSDLGPYFASPTSPSPMVTYVEAKFLEAEANMRLGNTQEAADAHNEAIMAHVELVTGAPDPTFYVAEASETAGTISLDKIMTHKYIANFTQIEVFNDWRRTGIPALSPEPNANISVIPRRLITVQDERVSNPSANIVNDLTLPVWWDQ